jgi:sec-independent protein translocase protein TatA
MPNLGLSELLVIFMILVLVFGASRLPQLGEGLGKTIRSFKRGMSSDDKIEVTPAPAPPKDAPAARKGDADEPADAEIVDKA